MLLRRYRVGIQQNKLHTLIFSNALCKVPFLNDETLIIFLLPVACRLYPFPDRQSGSLVEKNRLW